MEIGRGTHDHHKLAKALIRFRRWWAWLISDGENAIDVGLENALSKQQDDLGGEEALGRDFFFHMLVETKFFFSRSAGAALRPAAARNCFCGSLYGTTPHPLLAALATG
jgi:hypothetical protein